MSKSYLISQFYFRVMKNSNMIIIGQFEQKVSYAQQLHVVAVAAYHISIPYDISIVRKFYLLSRKSQVSFKCTNWKLNVLISEDRYFAVDMFNCNFDVKHLKSWVKNLIIFNSLRKLFYKGMLVKPGAIQCTLLTHYHSLYLRQ